MREQLFDRIVRTSKRIDALKEIVQNDSRVTDRHLREWEEVLDDTLRELIRIKEDIREFSRVSNLSSINVIKIDCHICGDEKEVEEGTRALESDMCYSCYREYEGG